jgi:hypothetical protein
MSLRHQTSILTKEYRGGYTHTLRHSFFFRVLYMCIVLIALMAVTISSYQGTENLIGWVSQLGI